MKKFAAQIMAFAEESVRQTEKYAKQSAKLMGAQQQGNSAKTVKVDPSENIKNTKKSTSMQNLSGKSSFSKREQLLNSKLHSQEFKNNQRIFTQLVDRLEEKLEFLDVEDMRSLIRRMTAVETKHNRIGLKKLKANIDYQLECSSDGYVVEEHTIESAMLLVKEIKEAQNKRISQVA